MRLARFSTAMVAMFALAVGTPAIATVLVTVEAPGATQTTLTGYQLGLADLDNAANGLATMNFAGSSITGATTSGFVNISAANIYGGAGGTGQFGTVNGDAAIQLSNAVNYFGLWGSALDGQNTIAFYSGATLLGTYALQNVLQASPGYGNAYFGNPSGGGDSGEAFAFFNFRSDVAFDRIGFIQNGGGGFEFDNLTVGTPIVSAAPEPGTWAMLLLGFGAIGALMRSKRRSAFVTA